MHDRSPRWKKRIIQLSKIRNSLVAFARNGTGGSIVPNPVHTIHLCPFSFGAEKRRRTCTMGDRSAPFLSRRAMDLGENHLLPNVTKINQTDLPLCSL